jgi:hypothetical protein
MWRVGNGANVRIWGDRRINSTPTHMIQDTVQILPITAKVEELINLQENWCNIPLFKHIFSHELWKTSAQWRFVLTCCRIGWYGLELLRVISLLRVHIIWMLEGGLAQSLALLFLVFLLPFGRLSGLCRFPNMCNLFSGVPVETCCQHAINY